MNGRVRVGSLAAGAALAAAIFVGNPVRALAAPALLDVGTSTVVNVQLQSGALVIHTWNRNQVSIDSPGGIQWQQAGAGTVGPAIPHEFSFPGRTVQTVDGPLIMTPETFQMPVLPDAPHDAVIVRGAGDATITVPASTALLVTRVGRGSVEINDFNGAFVTVVQSGPAVFHNVNASGYVMALHGAIVAEQSTFARIRARTAAGNMFFSHCHATQIEASSVMGSIVYDDGSFEPGLARFETQGGAVALGVGTGTAAITAHSGAGRVYTRVDRTSTVDGVADTQAAVGGGNGPVVTASSQQGAVLLYNGSIRSHPQIARQFPTAAMWANGQGALGALKRGASPQRAHPLPQRAQPPRRPPAKRPRGGVFAPP